MRYPEEPAGGYTRDDGSVAFYGRVQALLMDLEADRPGTGLTVVDFGAGRGLLADETNHFRRHLQELRAPGRTVIGVDVDPVVHQNPRMDEGRLIVDGRIPIDDESVDLIVSDFTWEHVDDPERAARELERILRPGGWICSRTPNRWGYIALGARLVPNRRHVAALRRLQPGKKEEDTFPTRYRLNTRGAIERHFPADRFSVHAFTLDAEPHLYAGGSRAVTSLVALAHHLPASLRSMWQVFIQKKGPR